MITRDIALLLVMTILLPSLLAGCREDTSFQASGKVVKIGLIAPLSGPAQGWGQSGLKGIKTALALQPYLLNGDRVELVIADDLNTPALTREALIRLVKVDKVVAVLLFSDSAAALEAVKFADDLKTPIIILLSTHPGLNRSEWVNQFVFDDITQGTVAALYIRDELLVDRVGVFTDTQNPHSVALASQFTRKFTSAGGMVIPVELRGDEEDFSEIVKGLKTNHVEFLYAPLQAQEVIGIEHAARDMLWDVGVMVGDGLLSQILLQYEQELDVVDGMLATDLYSGDLPRTEYGKMATRKFKKMFGSSATTFSALGCEGTSVLLAAMDKCGTSDNRTCINNKLRSDVEFSGIFGQVRSLANGKVERPVFINKIKGNKLKSVVKVY